MNTRLDLKKLTLSIVAACAVSLATAQTATTLTVGDKAPQLKVSTWIKGTPTQSFDSGKIYVVEFWATWCGPCRQMMPHLSEMAKKYAGKVTFDSFDIWENAESATPLSPSDLLAKVKQFVSDMGDKMSYNIAADTDDGYMAKSWMAAAGQPGIPTAFVVKGGQVVWIGHPYYMEKPLQQIVDGTYDQAAFIKEYQQKQQANAAREAAWKAVLDPVKKAMDAKDYQGAIEKIDAGVKAVPVLKFSLYLDKFKALLAMDPSKGIDFIKDWHKESADMAIEAIGTYADTDGLPTDVYRLGVTYELEATNSPNYLAPFTYDTLAKFYFKLGDVDNAVASEQKAIDLGNKAIQDGKYSGSLLPSDIKKMQDGLDHYKAAHKSS